MRIAILYIGTGRYSQFFKYFFDSCQKYFFRDKAEIQYYVWTDDLSLNYAPNINLVYHTCQGFPADSLFRFDMFLEKKKELETFDYLFFFNANCIICNPIGPEILPSEDDGGLVCVIGLGGIKYQKIPCFYPYERNKKSKAYISPWGKRYRYYCGGLNGGTAKKYLEMVDALARNIHDDYDNGIVAIYHDESHLNHYFRIHKCKELGPKYMYPESKKLPSDVKVLIVDKTKYDSYFNKNRDLSFWGKIKKAIWRINWGFKWYI